MTTWVIEPRDTLVVRDGRPIQDGAPAMRSLDFPWPSTVAGLFRTRAGTDEGGRFTMAPPQARQIAVRGPLLALLSAEGRAAELLVPAPRDCLWHREGEGAARRARRYRLVPMSAEDHADAQSDLQEEGLLLVGPESKPPEGKAERGPAFWRWGELEAWLTSPSPLALPPGELGRRFGHGALLHEGRVHVAIERGTQTAAESKLFSTDALRFWGAQAEGERPGATAAAEGGGGAGEAKERLALWAECAEEGIEEGVVLCGGERRPSFLRRAALQRPGAPEGLGKLAAGGRLRVVLLTPAIFGGGFVPASRQIRGAKIVAACVPRHEPVSGWDFEHRGPKRTRWAVPAGSVYWVDLPAGRSPQAWIGEVWMSCISDDEQDQRDGFGLCVVGVG